MDIAPAAPADNVDAELDRLISKRASEDRAGLPFSPSFAPGTFPQKRAVGSIDKRLRRLEERGLGPWPECAGTAGHVVVYDETDHTAQDKSCSACGRPLVVINVVYDSPAGDEGGGVIPIG